MLFKWMVTAPVSSCGDMDELASQIAGYSAPPPAPRRTEAMGWLPSIIQI